MSEFKTVEIADSSYRENELCFMTVKSPNLRGRGDICFFIPEESGEDLPLVILLHGVFGSSWSWAYSGGAHLVARKLINEGIIPPVILAMPSDGLIGDGSGYVKHPQADYEKWIIDDIPKAAKILSDKVSAKSSLYISGLSMGGFGALRIGAKYASNFAGVSAHSAACQAECLKQFFDENFDYDLDLSQDDFSPLFWMLKNKADLPRLRFDCGVDDFLIDGNRLLHRQLTEAQIYHIFEEFPGDHTWEYWHEHLHDTLKFFFAG